MIRADVLRQVGLFWERLFLYWEDTDLDLRVQRYGWTTCVVADAWVHHAIHGSTDNGVVAYYHFRNALLVAWRHARRRIVARATAHLAYVVTRRWAGAALRRRPVPMPETRGLFAGFGTIARWTFRAPRDARLAPPPVYQDEKRLAIVHVVRRYAPMVGGTETLCSGPGRGAGTPGHRVTVLTLDHDVTGVMAAVCRPMTTVTDIRVVRVPDSGRGGSRSRAVRGG